MRKPSFLLLALAVIILTLSACSPSRKRYVIGVSQCSEDVWRDKLNNELLSAAYAAGDIQLDIMSAADNSELQCRQIDQFIEQGVDLLIVSPNQQNSISSTVDKAADKGIPVILFDRKTSTNRYTAL